MGAQLIRAVNGPMMGILGGKAYAVVFVDTGTDLVEMRVSVLGEDEPRVTKVGRLNVARYLDESSEGTINDALHAMLLGR